MNAVVAVLGLVAAACSAWGALKAARAAEAANSAAKDMAAIEASRRHQELTPELAVRIEPFNPGDQRYFRLHVGLAGPFALRQVSSLKVSIRDDRPGRGSEGASFLAQRATAEQIAAQIWGPLRLTPHQICGGGSADANGRSITMVEGLRVGESLPLQLEPSPLPPWTGSDVAEAQRWWDQTVGNNVRLQVEATPVDGQDPWILPLEVDITEARGGVTIW